MSFQAWYPGYAENDGMPLGVRNSRLLIRGESAANVMIELSISILYVCK